MKYLRQLKKVRAHLNAAKGYAELSYAKRLKVGAVLVKDDRIISIGYNGSVSGRSNFCEFLVDDSGKYRTLKGLTDSQLENCLSLGWKLITKEEVVHSEANAILYSARNGIKTDGCMLVVTHSPCYECAKMIAQCGITEVYYETEYRDTESLSFLKECGIQVTKIGDI